MKVRTFIAACVVVGVLLAPAVLAQEQSEPPGGQTPDPAQDPAQDPAAPDATPDASEEPKGSKKIPLGLYVYAGFGGGDTDPFNTSIVTSATANSENTLDLDGVTYARAAIGWRLPNKKGDFRLIFDGFSEDGYTYDAVGRQAALPPGSPTISILEPLDWWTVDIEDGVLRSERRPPLWTLDDDNNGNGAVDPDEPRYPTNQECLADPSLNCLTHVQPVADNLLNRFQNWDLVYGRVWGPRHFQGRWFAGLRYMTFEGNLLATAWLNDSQPGEGFTDGTFLRTLNFTQEMTGIGPTGLIEARWNFFNQHLQVYFNAQVAFLISSVSADTGLFFTLVNTPTDPRVVVPLPARLDESRDKSVWNTKAEAGIRILFKGGLEFDLSYMIQGYLDAILVPSTIQIPATLGQSALGVSAVYNTQDIVLDAWRAGIGFQF